MADASQVNAENTVGGWVSPEALATEYSAEHLEDLYDQQFEDWWQMSNSAGDQSELSQIGLEGLDLIRDAVFVNPEASFW
ncbi:hypothetical protein [Halorussus sp. AFM4]|uniref:hypothetical protein n=1 Tax=Halorussus sp. AFM4 TaxID=3421651 RepID=UPI003EC0F4DA